MKSERCLILLLPLLLSGCVGQRRTDGQPEFRPSFEIHTVLSKELLGEANHGRVVLGANGRFLIPAGVKRVWIDVGASQLETTQEEWRRSPDMVLIGIEPLAECWRSWPNHGRLIALPVALSGERGSMDFNVNAFAATSSLLKSAEGTSFDKLTKTMETRKVPVLRLEDVLERIPSNIDVEYVKTDVQGHDLQVLKSGGEQLRRVGRIKTEIINALIYEGTAEHRPGTEREFTSYLEGVGFRFERDAEVQPDREWLDKFFVNVERR